MNCSLPSPWIFYALHNSAKRKKKSLPTSKYCTAFFRPISLINVSNQNRIWSNLTFDKWLSLINYISILLFIFPHFIKFFKFSISGHANWSIFLASRKYCCEKLKSSIKNFEGFVVLTIISELWRVIISHFTRNFWTMLWF